ncbi:MAG: chemotaxis protein CheW [Nitrospirae bacterium RIFCSPLOW2_12_42_9]|nr:MAG: chemotaxis protein CheW [Nitrospirae bacterium GWA2_42_11]OGW61245.1 MAG: chemotaxis protein CheW [Nitrospirae bacterium RIFCSPLOW2_12_42_9]HAS17171.1 chemotaxis protein CheW [Nitrospiraceae bacterium]HBI24645.1 chemotaxis protein CheW [Nitrospiraceae bacterium]
MTTAVETINNLDTSALEGKYLTFILNREEYGLEILKVREIIGLMDITPVPQTPAFMKGIINLRGKVIPVVDQRLKFGMPAAEYTKETCIIVVNIDNRLMGIIVDTVSEVLDIAAKDIEPAPSLGNKIKTDFILGMGKIKGKVKILLDIDKVLTLEELAMLNN